MINFIDEKGVKHSAVVECKKTKGVNGEKSLSGTIYTNDEILEGIGRGWRLEFENEKYCLTYVYPIDEGNRIVVEFDAVHEFFFDLNKKVVYSELNGSNTAKAYLDLIFSGSGYSYVIEVNVPAFEKEGFGMRNRLDLFKEFISDTGVEFSVNGKVVRILEKVGSNLSTIVKKGFNLNELRIEKDPGSFITYKKGFGAWVDEDDHSKGRLEVEYLSPLASIYGKLEGDPIVDERYKVASNFETRLKNDVESSYGISVDIDMEDLTKAGYEYEQPHEGDYIMAINKDLGFEQKIRIMSYETSYDTNGNIIDHKVACGSDNIIRKSIKEDDDFRKEIQAGLEGAISTSNKAWVSANGKNAVFEGPDEPTATAIGDTWFQIDGDKKIMRIWNGYEWKPVFNPGEIEKKVEQAEQEVQTAVDQSNTAINNASQAIADAGFAKNQSATALSQAGQAVADANTAITDAKSALDAYRNMEIGGRNWLVNTMNPSGVNPIYTLGSEPSISGKLTIRNGWTKVEHNAGSNEIYYRFNAPKENHLGGLTAGKTYTISMTVKGKGSVNYRAEYKTTGSWISVPEPIPSTPLSGTEGKTIVFTVKVPIEATAFYLSIDCKENIAGNYVEFYRPMLVEGNKATDWSPAPEDVQVQITEINGELSRKVSQQTFDTLQGTVNTQSTQINQNKADILLRATKTEVNTLTGTVNSLDSRLGIEAGKISALNSKTDGHTTSIGLLETSYSGLNSTVTQVKNNLEGMEIGGRNLILNTESLDGYSYKTSDKYMNFNIARTTKRATGYDNTFSATTIDIAEGVTYTASFFARTSVASVIMCYWYDPNTTIHAVSSTGQIGSGADGEVLVTTSSEWKRYWVTWTQYTTTAVKHLIIGRNHTTPEGTIVEIAGVKLEKGNKATDWSPAPEDYTTVQAFSALEQNLSGFKTTVANTYADKTEVNQLAGQWTTTTNLVNGHTSQISSLGTAVNLRATKADLISQINISPESILIASGKIQIKGDTYIDNGVIKTAHIADLAVSGAKIANASIASAKIISLDASKITVGTLTGHTINGAVINGGSITQSDTGGYSLKMHNGKFDMFRDSDLIMRLAPTYNASTLKPNGASIIQVPGEVFSIGTQHINSETFNYVFQIPETSHAGDIKWNLFGQGNDIKVNSVNIGSDGAVRKIFADASNNKMRIGSDHGVIIGVRQSHGGYYDVFDGTGTTINLHGGGANTSSNRGAGISFGRDGGTNAGGARIWSLSLYQRTYSAAANMHITTDGTIGRAVSARKYKTDIQSEHLSKAKTVLQISPSSWHDKVELTTGKATKRHYGFIADDFHELGLTEVVQYGSDGQVEGLAYDRISMYHNVILQDHEQQLATVTQQLNSVSNDRLQQTLLLESKLLSLEETVVQLKQEIEQLK